MLIPKAAFAVAKCASKDAGRYAFNGVQIERREDGKCRASATDGHRLMFVDWQEPKVTDFPPVFDANPTHEIKAGFRTIVPTDAFTKIGKAVQKSGPKPILGYAAVDEVSSNGVVKMAATDLATTTRLDTEAIDGTFPPYQDCVPEHAIITTDEAKAKELTGTAVVCHVNPKLLREILQALEIVGDDYQKCVSITIPVAKNRPIRLDVRNSEGVTATAVLMPVNHD